MMKAIRLLGGGLLVWAFADFAMSYAEADLWKTAFNVDLPEPFWKYSSVIEGVIGSALIKFGSQSA
jgi:hypothetical protein